MFAFLLHAFGLTFSVDKFFRSTLYISICRYVVCCFGSRRVLVQFMTQLFQMVFIRRPILHHPLQIGHGPIGHSPRVMFLRASKIMQKYRFRQVKKKIRRHFIMFLKVTLRRNCPYCCCVGFSYHLSCESLRAEEQKMFCAEFRKN